MPVYNFPTETIELPSKGLLYPHTNPLSFGKVDVYYMNAIHEDILTNKNYIKQGVVFDKLLEKLIATPINYDDLLVGDKDAIFIAARILAYGKDYKISNNLTVDLTELNEIYLDPKLVKQPGVNEFDFTLPVCKKQITFKILTHKDEKDIDAEVAALQKISPESSPLITTRFKYMITSVDGKRDNKSVREFIDKGELLSRDSLALRSYINKISPGINLNVKHDGEDVAIQIGIEFFWPTA